MKNDTTMSCFAPSPCHCAARSRQSQHQNQNQRRAISGWAILALALFCTVTALPSSTAKATPRHHHSHPPLTISVELKPQPGTEMDKQARALEADLLEDASHHHDQPIVLTGTARLSSHQGETGTFLFVQLQSYRLCGSAGCMTSIYRKTATGWDTLLDGVNGNIRLSRHHHNGLADLIIDGNDRWIFDGQHYQDTLTSP